MAFATISSYCLLIVGKVLTLGIGGLRDVGYIVMQNKALNAL